MLDMMWYALDHKLIREILYIDSEMAFMMWYALGRELVLLIDRWVLDILYDVLCCGLHHIPLQ